MPINNRQRAATSAELMELRSRLPVTDEAFAERLDLTTAELHAALSVDGADPREVWRVRDLLVAVAEAKGVDVPEFSTLVDARRDDAARWFGVWEAPAPSGL